MAIDAAGGDGGKNGVPLVLWPEHDKDNQQWEFILITQGKEIKTTSQLAKKRATEIVNATAKFTQKAFNKVEELVMKSINQSINNIKIIFKDGLIELKYNKKNKSVFFRVGFDDPLAPLKNLKENFMDEFAKVELGKIEFDITRKEIELSFVNTLASMGQHVDFIVTLSLNWNVSINGFKVYNLRLKKLILPLIPNKATKGIGNKISSLVKGINFNIKKYQGKKLLIKAFNEAKKEKSNLDKVKIPGIIIEEIVKNDTKFLIKIKFSKNGNIITVKDNGAEKEENKEDKKDKCSKLKGKKLKKCLKNKEKKKKKKKKTL